MATKYRKIEDSDIHAMLDDVRKNHHFQKDEVTVTLLFAYTNDGDWPLKDRGFRVIGKTRKSNARERALGAGWVIIELDESWWEAAKPEAQMALLDHEMCHVPELEYDRQGEPYLPKLIDHDYEFSGFAAIIERHGANSIEHVQYKAFDEAIGPLFKYAMQKQGKEPALAAVK